MEPTHVGSYRELGNTNYEGLDRGLKDFDGEQCTVCGGATGNIIGGHEGRKGDVSGEACPICGGDIDNKLAKDTTGHGHSHHAGHHARQAGSHHTGGTGTHQRGTSGSHQTGGIGGSGSRDLSAGQSEYRDDGREFGTRHLNQTQSGQTGVGATGSGNRDVDNTLSRGVQNMNISRN